MSSSTRTRTNGHPSPIQPQVSISASTNPTAAFLNPASIVGTPEHELAQSLPQTDFSLWRLKVSDGGRHVWHYLTPTQAKNWPQSTEDKFWLGLQLNLPTLQTPKTPLESAENCWSFYQNLQSIDGHFSGEYGGPMFLLPGLIIGMYVTKTQIPEEWKVEIVRYLANRVNKDGGWGLHIEGSSTVFGTSCNYVVLRILGLSTDHPLCLKARNHLHSLGGTTSVPAWGKLWLAVLNVYDWSGMDPIPPELWCLPDWVPIHPWRWWIHTRMVYLPMGYLYGKRFRCEKDELVESLREELYTEPYESINWASHRGNIHEVDAFAPHTKVLRGLMNCLSVYESCSIPPIRKAGISRAYQLLKQEDENTSYQCLGPVNKMLNFVSRYVEIELEKNDSPIDSEGNDVLESHREKLKDFLWLSKDGMMMTGTNGSQLWDTSFISQALVSSAIAHNPKFKPNCIRVLEWLDVTQIRENPKHYKENYRFSTKGAWPFSTKEQGYTVSDCTAEGMKSVLMLQSVDGIPKLVDQKRLRDSVDLLLTMQNSGGGFASYETINGPKMLEWINPASCFSDIMIEYNYPECTTSVVTALLMFKKESDYRAKDIDRVVSAAIGYILKAQRADGSWFGSWAISFTYAAMFALESLSLSGRNCSNCEQVMRACEFLLSKQKQDGGWGETFESCTTGQYVQAPASQVVQTSWVIIALIHAGYHEYVDSKPIEDGVRLIMSRQQPDGRFEQELIEGIFNRNCAISYPNYKFAFPIFSLGLANHALGDKFTVENLV